MLLGEHERQRFVRWLKQDIESNRLLAGQAVKIPGYGELLAKRKMALANAEQLVLDELEDVVEE